MKRCLPKGTTLEVALACLKEDKRRSPELIEEVARIAAEYKSRDRAFDAHKERARINTQRALFAALPSLGPHAFALEELKSAMIDRARALLDIGQCEACDALLEFVPEADAEAMLNEYFNPPDEVHP